MSDIDIVNDDCDMMLEAIIDIKRTALRAVDLNALQAILSALETCYDSLPLDLKHQVENEN